MCSSDLRQSTVPVEHAPDPSLDLDEPVCVRARPVAGAAPIELWGRVAAVDLPLIYTGRARTDVEVTD